jgi:hypothetical protein
MIAILKLTLCALVWCACIVVLAMAGTILAIFTGLFFGV